MIKFFSLLIIPFVGVVILLSSCGDVQLTENVEDNVEYDEYYEFQDFNLSEFQIPAIIALPDETANIGASTKPEVIHNENDYQWDIKIGQNFNLHIEDLGEEDELVKEKKEQLADRTFYKVNYFIDEEDLIMYERTLVVSGTENASPTVGYEHKSYHVYGQKKVGKIYYELRSSEEGYNKTIIDLMVKSIKSLRPIDK